MTDKTRNSTRSSKRLSKQDILKQFENDSSDEDMKKDIENKKLHLEILLCA